MFAPLLDAVSALKNRRGRPTRRPQKPHADKGCDYAKCRAACIARRIKHRRARCGIESSSYLGKHRWVMEASIHFAFRFDCFSVLLGDLRKGEFVAIFIESAMTDKPNDA